MKPGTLFFFDPLSDSEIPLPSLLSTQDISKMFG